MFERAILVIDLRGVLIVGEAKILKGVKGQLE